MSHARCDHHMRQRRAVRWEVCEVRSRYRISHVAAGQASRRLHRRHSARACRSRPGRHLAGVYAIAAHACAGVLAPRMARRHPRREAVDALVVARQCGGQAQPVGTGCRAVGSGFRWRGSDGHLWGARRGLRLHPVSDAALGGHDRAHRRGSASPRHGTRSSAGLRLAHRRTVRRAGRCQCVAHRPREQRGLRRRLADGCNGPPHRRDRRRLCARGACRHSRRIAGRSCPLARTRRQMVHLHRGDALLRRQRQAPGTRRRRPVARPILGDGNGALPHDVRRSHGQPAARRDSLVLPRFVRVHRRLVGWPLRLLSAAARVRSRHGAARAHRKWRHRPRCPRAVRLSPDARRDAPRELRRAAHDVVPCAWLPHARAGTRLARQPARSLRRE